MEIINLINKNKNYEVRILDDECESILFTKQHSVYGDLIVHRNDQNKELYDIRIVIGPEHLGKQHSNAIGVAFHNAALSELGKHPSLYSDIINEPFYIYSVPNLFTSVFAVNLKAVYQFYLLAINALRVMNDNVHPRVYSGILH